MYVLCFKRVTIMKSKYHLVIFLDFNMLVFRYLVFLDRFSFELDSASTFVSYDTMGRCFFFIFVNFDWRPVYIERCIPSSFDVKMKQIMHVFQMMNLEKTYRTRFLGAPRKTNMAPENRPLEKDIPIGNHHF